MMLREYFDQATGRRIKLGARQYPGNRVQMMRLEDVHTTFRGDASKLAQDVADVQEKMMGILPIEMPPLRE